MMFHQGIKRVYLTWTQEWRAKHKKIRVDDVQKRHARKTTKVRKAVVGMSLDEIKRRRAETREERDKTLDSAAKEVKERTRKKIAAKQADKAKQNQKAIRKDVPKAKVARGGKR